MVNLRFEFPLSWFQPVHSRLISAHQRSSDKHLKEGEEEEEVPALPAVLVRQSVQGDGSLSTGTSEEAFHGIVPPQLVILIHTAIRRLEVGVAALEVPATREMNTFYSFNQCPLIVSAMNTFLQVTARHFISLIPLIFSSICSFFTRALK